MLLRVVTSLKTTYSSPLFFSFSFFCISSIQLNSERMVRMFLTHHINQSFSCRTSMCVSYVLYIISFAFCRRGCHNITIDCQIGDFDYLITHQPSTHQHTVVVKSSECRDSESSKWLKICDDSAP
jgi:hypothetical protein